jgi:hypothetical protein
MAIKVQIREDEVTLRESAKGHTYIHFGGQLKERFKVLAERAGWTRKLNAFGVHLFTQALVDAEQDYAAQNKAKQSK